MFQQQNIYLMMKLNEASRCLAQEQQENQFLKSQIEDYCFNPSHCSNCIEGKILKFLQSVFVSRHFKLVEPEKDL